MEPCSAFVLRRATPACLWQTRRITQQPGRIGQSPLVQSHHLRAPQPAQQMNVMGRDDDSGAEFIQRFKKMQQALRHVGIDVARRFIRDQTLWPRSEEHTAELQSLMCISYAVFCL